MNIFDYTVPEVGEDFKSLYKSKNIDIVRIVSSKKLEDKLYIQDVDEFVILLEGRALLDIDGNEVVLKKGDTLFIPAKKPHRLLKTTKGTLWLAIYMKSS